MLLLEQFTLSPPLRIRLLIFEKKKEGREGEAEREGEREGGSREERRKKH